MILNTTENITIEHRSLYEFCNDDEQCDRVKYQNGCDNPDVQAMHDDENGEPIKVKIHGMEDGDKAEVEIEKSSDSSDEEENKNNEEEIRNMNAAKNVPVYQDNSKAADTYYVRMSDTRRFMEEVDMSITEALDSIIEANAASSVDADNLFLVVEASDNMDESTIERLKSFGINVINYDSVKESLDTSSVEEEVNPIMAMKRNPATIAIANVNEHYYVAGADLVNYMEAAEIDNAIEALNNIIEAHADSDIDADNICVVMDEASEDLRDSLIESEVAIQEKSSYSDATNVNAAKKWYRKFIVRSKSGLADKKDIEDRIKVLEECVKKMERARNNGDPGEQIKYMLKDIIPFNSIVRLIKNKDIYAGLGALTDMFTGVGGIAVRALTYNKMLDDQIRMTKDAIEYLKEQLKNMD